MSGLELASEMCHGYGRRGDADARAGAGAGSVRLRGHGGRYFHFMGEFGGPSAVPASVAMRCLVCGDTIRYLRVTCGCPVCVEVHRRMKRRKFPLTSPRQLSDAGVLSWGKRG